MRKIAIVAVLLVSTSVSARAQSVAATMTNWGLMGAWSTNCEAAAGRGLATKLRYAVQRDGNVVHHRDFGDDTAVDKVAAARVTPEGFLELKILSPQIARGPSRRTFALKKIEPGVVRAMYSYDADGEYSVKDGKFTSNGKDTPLQHKCD